MSLWSNRFVMNSLVIFSRPSLGLESSPLRHKQTMLSQLVFSWPQQRTTQQYAQKKMHKHKPSLLKETKNMQIAGIDTIIATIVVMPSLRGHTASSMALRTSMKSYPLNEFSLGKASFSDEDPSTESKSHSQNKHFPWACAHSTRSTHT